MKKKKIYMIGNSHIDPVWFWDWDEGMQEVKATFASALDRMKEYPEFTFTATSTAFLEWLQITSPDIFEEIRERVKEGRFLMTGGWFIEPDCILPCTEAFIRQGLYGQRYLMENFGIMCRTASNVDSFGHSPMLPQILKKSGMKEYVFMRPRLEEPLFWWESRDGSKVLSLSLQSEYTTWFYESTREGVMMAKEAADQAGLHGMACCFGVGNHGGGPTIQNIETVYQLRKECPDLELDFSGFHEFFDGLTQEEKQTLPVKQVFLDKVNTGCYTADSEYKRKNRLAERRLMTADFMLCMEQAVTEGSTDNPLKHRMKPLWKTLLFNQFHDTLGSTAVKPARDEALMLLSKVCAESKQIWTLSLQNIVNTLDTRGEGFPLFLFNPTGHAYEGPVEVELNWFCKDHLILLNEKGEEIPYQRTYTQAKVRNYNLGGRRAIAFQVLIPAGGFIVYRTVPGIPTLAWDIRKEQEFPLPKQITGETVTDEAASQSWKLTDEDPYILENDSLAVKFDRNGHLSSLYDKKRGYEGLSAPVRFPIITDERDTWGGDQGRTFGDSGQSLEFLKLELVENGPVRKRVRASYGYEGTILNQTYTLWRNSDYLEVYHHLFFNRTWAMLHLAFPVTGSPDQVTAECAGGSHSRRIQDRAEYSMHRFLDITTPEGAGLCIANDGKYAYTLEDGILNMKAARSSIYAQGNGRNWYNEREGYEYTDQGVQEFTLLLKPHGSGLRPEAYYRLAQHAEKPYICLADHIHTGSEVKKAISYSMLECSAPNIRITAVKQGEDEESLIIRLLEIEGRHTESFLKVGHGTYPVTIGSYEILTLKIDPDKNTCSVVNLLEL